MNRPRPALRRTTVVDLNSAGVATRRTLFTKGATSGSHTLVVKVYGNAGYVDVDTFFTAR
ncbi:hypothetical protein [Sporichthya sp.]|uniref:hypothetical protein n=1 Tax=Sporichthya sp. TaxID=65475 RepID=UPI00179578DA|nr:hypothetical protein [Sporichthya sp.]MBA3745431.1 hypothetical protein [Sporichthya sp.]